MKYRRKHIIAVVFLIVGAMSLWVYLQKQMGGRNTQEGSQVRSVVASISADQLDELVKREDVFILDVHIPQQPHIPGTDAFIPYNELSDHVEKLPTDKNTPIVVYCRSGSMSREAAQELAGLGYTQIYDLEGGTNAYKEKVSRVVITPVQTSLGTVVYGDVPATEFVLTNYMAKPLAITNVSTSCGCTSASVEKRQLSAYESTIVRVLFNPAVHGDDTDLGQLTRTIYVDTDNPDFGQVTASITANVVKP